MRFKGRRRLDVAFIVVGGAAVAGVTALSALAYNEERLDRIWTSASIQPDGSSTIHEVIDDNFANASDRHGLLRRVPSLPVDAPVQVSSPDAPASINSITPYTFDDGTPGAEIRIGDATKVVHGRHRYTLDYELGTLVTGSTVTWNSVGTGWLLPIQETDAHLLAPNAFISPTCKQGTARHNVPCHVEQVAPGHLVVHVGKLDAGQGVTLTAQLGAPLSGGAPAAPAAPATLPELPGAGIALPALVAGLVALPTGLVISRLIRRAGRERVSSGAAGADAAFAQTAESEVRIDAADLADLATTDFAPPEGITSPMGGVILAEAVHPEHKVAWLIEAAIAGLVDIQEEGGKAQRLVRTAPGSGDTETILDMAFRGRDEITLGGYDPSFASGWTKVGTDLETWSRSGDLWDRAGDRNKVLARVFGVLAIIVGVLGAIGGGAMTGRWGTGWLALVIVGAFLAGGGIAAVLRSWELRVRTVKGSGLWLRVESFRRFLHESEASHAEDAARRGVLREYTAWAVAVGEIDHWRHAVQSATTIPQNTVGLGYVFLASSLASSTSHASTAPSSSGGGGGGGMGGGGGGGGGGGNW